MTAYKIITPEQCRMARSALDWSRDVLAEKSGVARQTLADFETGKRQPYERTLAPVRAALEKGGVVFTPENGTGPGVALKKKGKKR